MSTPDFDELELEALRVAAQGAVGYLKSIQADALRAEFAKLEPAQAMQFLELIVDGFGAHLRHKLCTEPPMRSAAHD